MMGELYGVGYAQMAIWRLEQERRERASLARAGWGRLEQRPQRLWRPGERHTSHPRLSLWSAVVRR